MKNILLLDFLKNSHVKPAFFGLGFIQCKVSQYERYHFYHEDLYPIVDMEEEIHDHRYDFVSTILKGQLINKLYEFTPNEKGEYYSELESCNKDNIVTDKKRTQGNIVLLSMQTYKENESYEIKFEQLHTIEAKNCITHLVRTDYKKKLATVVRHNKVEKNCPFSKQIDEKTCWQIIEEILIRKLD